MTEKQIEAASKAFASELVKCFTAWLRDQRLDSGEVTAPHFVQLFAKTLAQEYVTSTRHTRRQQTTECPIATVSATNNRAKYEAECAGLVAQGYKLVSASCSAHVYEGVLDEVFMAVFTKE